MNQRLVTVAIVFISFATTFGLTSRHTAPVAITAAPPAAVPDHVDPALANEPEAATAPQARAAAHSARSH